MEITGEHFVKAPRERVWEALNNPSVLQGAIPGCEAMTSSAPDNFEATVRIAVGPIRARFAGVVTLQDIDPPNSYRIVGEGKGGTADFAKGQARVSLEPEDEGTRVKYVVSAQVGGKLAQIGGRLMEGTAKKVAKEFFDNFADQVTAGVTPPEAKASTNGSAQPVTREERLPGAVMYAAAGVASMVLWAVAILFGLWK